MLIRERDIQRQQPFEGCDALFVGCGVDRRRDVSENISIVSGHIQLVCYSTLVTHHL